MWAMTYATQTARKEVNTPIWGHDRSCPNLVGKVVNYMDFVMIHSPVYDLREVEYL
jgi:hypothetical protein